MQCSCASCILFIFCIEGLKGEFYSVCWGRGVFVSHWLTWIYVYTVLGSLAVTVLAIRQPSPISQPAVTDQSSSGDRSVNQRSPISPIKEDWCDGWRIGPDWWLIALDWSLRTDLHAYVTQVSCCKLRNCRTLYNTTKRTCLKQNK